ncbi:S8 family serine peptidase [Bradyrhizobium sp. GCM10027634]|uniref:S8 family serine peptidase n=1 Tax=unclassified Bradyrhizobium TaxID=2631580 RepID=UPI00263B064B|nr:S8 family serine peptidase [Bradyrhizobium sp. WYCCWR 12677]MDN5005274.1 S8 family serine peptidase [Bradyrhizobium sp. WYCCWR 12677]
MAKRGVNDQYGNFSDANADAVEWEFVGLNFASAHVGSMDMPAAHSEVFETDVSSSDAGAPESFAAKKGGGTTSGGTTSGGTTSGGTTSGSTTVGQGTTTTNFTTVTMMSPTLNPPAGNSALPTDTYFYKEWNLTSSTGGINVTKAWQNYTGLGIKVGVIDDGIDYNHTDLNPHYLFNLDYDATNGGNDAYGTSTDDHGTTVAGVIGAARDGTGTVGVAYDAGIAGFRISYGTGGGPSQINDAFSHTLSSGMDVVNASWGYATAYSDNFFSSGFAASKTAILNEVMYGRGGLGTSVVFASGNGRGSGDNVNYHNYQNDPYVITVGGVDPTGHVATFSTPGAALLVSAPGGAYTDDRVGSAGYVSGDYISMSGTSYSAPAVSGVIALMLQANPNLGFRDIQDILAYSAKETDPTNAGWHINGAHDWNGGGLHYSEDYGFGLVDATAAVRLAESWRTQKTYADMSTESATHGDNAAIPDGTGSLSSQITFASSLKVEKMVIDLNITHASPSDLTVTLTGPDGTSAALASHPTGGTGSGIVFETTANTFWGDDAKGTWTLTVTDSVSGNSGTLNGWTLTALGDAPTTPTTYVYTDEFATMAGSNRVVLTDSSGTAQINTAAVTTGSYLDLNPGATDTIAGKTLQIASTSIIKNVWAGVGNDTIIANDFGDTIQAGLGNNTIVTGKGADILYAAQAAGSSDTFMFNALSSTTDTILNWVSGNNTINVAQLLSSVGYAGNNPITDGWLSFVSDAKGGTNVVVDAHNGTTPQTIADVVGITPTLLHESTTSWSLIV